ncbi:PTS sugar transporter subunit IIA [Oenococcus kitaharae]|uniref:PTS system mannose-specific IIA component n=1 Tax=Oenococcus kitaharae DSM 17330 TaxID=1045004 RepID=G9WHX1_9LACO|nr:PTS sugar transporter subunit IIA [Oenococcus kitaharae]EHN58856.1 PTS system mannose-specific IIA component [Oenococcus kitaharae DSM 17330]MCV3296838.1 PTS sugar transporter subunit IIA [Oenococcus kitaharae]OEY81812.1 hypothetical protein NT96_08605 [Oenococcus kitaharae]OEY84043.1 hypothetical protein NT95_02665 [Oenococcus kitaharae]OEY85599.1 hypothetical protein NV75_03770 [Oenococcus kitaharae]
MVTIILSGHGQAAPGLLSAFEMIFGHSDQIHVVTFSKGEGVDDLKAHYQTVLGTLAPGSEVLFLVDLFGGSPYNAATQLVYGHTERDIVAGVNLPMLLEAGSMLAGSLSAIVSHLKEIAPGTVRVFSDEIKSVNTTASDEGGDTL